MKCLLKLYAIFIITILTLSSCGDDGGGSSKKSGVTPVGTFTKKVEFPTIAFENYDQYMFGSLDFYHCQLLYKPESIAGSGYITSIKFKRYAKTFDTTTCSHATIKLAHTSINSLGGLSTPLSTNIKDKGSAVTVLNDSDITIPAGEMQEYFEIRFDKEFNYNGVDNLIIDFTRTHECLNTTTVVIGKPDTAYTGTAIASDDIHPDTTTSILEKVHHTKFVFEGGDNKVDFTSSYDKNVAPFTNMALPFQKAQMLYNSSAITGSGLITGIGLQVYTATTAEQTYTYTMKLGHSTKTALDATFANNFDVGAPVTVASSIQFKVPAGIPGGEFIWLPIPDGNFTYNGTSNLVIELIIEAATGVVELATHDTSSICRILGSPSSLTANGEMNGFTHQIALRFYGGTMGVITGGNITTESVFSTGTSGTINLYRAAELGTSGTITSIACRLNDSSSDAADYANYRITIGHSNNNQLETTAANNFISQLNALNGTVSVPAGLVKGDWIEIQLTTYFSYDGKSNLAVWLGTTAASGSGAINGCTYSAASSASRYPGQTADAVPGSETIMPQNYKLDMRFKILK